MITKGLLKAGLGKTMWLKNSATVWMRPCEYIRSRLVLRLAGQEQISRLSQPGCSESTCVIPVKNPDYRVKRLALLLAIPHLRFLLNCIVNSSAVYHLQHSILSSSKEKYCIDQLNPPWPNERVAPESPPFFLVGPPGHVRMSQGERIDKLFWQIESKVSQATTTLHCIIIPDMAGSRPSSSLYADCNR